MLETFDGGKVIEPFAGGGIVYMYKYIKLDIDITNIDIDETVKPRLDFMFQNTLLVVQ